MNSDNGPDNNIKSKLDSINAHGKIILYQTEDGSAALDAA